MSFSSRSTSLGTSSSTAPTSTSRTIRALELVGRALERDPTVLLPAPVAVERDRVSQGILSQLQANGGSLRGTHKSLAEKLGADRNTVSRALTNLAASGVIAVATSKRHGSLVRLTT